MSRTYIEAKMDDIEIAVLVIAERIAARPATMSSKIYHELGVTGDKAWELLTDIARKFSISFEGFEFNLYFSDELEPSDSEKKRRPLTVAHLVDVARKGKWFEPNGFRIFI